jgi:hypothetical protein
VAEESEGYVPHNTLIRVFFDQILLGFKYSIKREKLSAFFFIVFFFFFFWFIDHINFSDGAKVTADEVAGSKDKWFLNDIVYFRKPFLSFIFWMGYIEGSTEFLHAVFSWVQDCVVNLQ